MLERSPISNPAEQPGNFHRVAEGLAHVAGAVVGVVEGVADFAANHGLGQVSRDSGASTSVENVSLARRHKPGDFSAFSPQPGSWNSTRRT